MPRRSHAVRNLLLLLVVAAAAGLAAGQIAPAGDVPPNPSPFVAAHGGHSSSVSAEVRGWSLGSEDVAEMSTGSAVELDPDHPELVVFYDVPEPLAGDAEFRYRLDGYDSSWTVTREQLAHYRRLPPGRYTFQVSARMPGEPWPEPQASLPVQHKPFFFQSWYAYLIVGAVVLVLTVQVLQQRDQLLKGQMGMVLQERNRIAGECHDTLMAGFAAISWQLEATAKLFRESVSTEHPATLSCDLARSMVAHCQAEARRIIWDLRNSDEITNSLSRALLDATSAWRERDHPQTTLQVKGTEIPISPGAVHHLVCIGQEAVTNAIRHGKPSTIRIALSYENELLRLSVQDDGNGFYPTDRSVRAGHFGIPVMEERARKLGGTLQLLSAPAGGTEVSVTVSFQRIHQPEAGQQHIVKWIGV